MSTKLIDKISKLNKQYNEITIYPDVNSKALYKGIGRVPGTFNKELIEFLKYTNGASIMDYCILGFKNSLLGTDIDKFVYELWGSNDCLAGKVIGFMITSTGDTFGYLMGNEYKNLSLANPIVYSSVELPHNLYLIGSSFNNFMSTFLNDVEQTIINRTDNLLLGVELPNWPIDVKHWIENDIELKDLYLEMGIGMDGIIKIA